MHESRNAVSMKLKFRIWRLRVHENFNNPVTSKLGLCAVLQKIVKMSFPILQSIETE